MPPQEIIENTANKKTDQNLPPTEHPQKHESPPCYGKLKSNRITKMKIFKEKYNIFQQNINIYTYIRYDIYYSM